MLVTIRDEFIRMNDIARPHQAKLIDKILKDQGAEFDYDSPGPGEKWKLRGPPS